MPPYRPGFWSSLVKSCYSGDFYRHLSRIRMGRSIGFLILLTLLVTVVAFLSLWFLLQRLDLSEESLLGSYDQAVPAFDAVYEDGVLETLPPEFEISLGLSPSGNILMSEGFDDSLPLLMRVNTDEELPDDILTKERYAGVYLYQDALYATSGYGGSILDYDDLNLPKELSFTKDSLRQLIKAGVPMLQEMAQNFLLFTAPLVLFVYFFLSNWVLALIFSLFGVLSLLIFQKSVDYAFLIKLSFYAIVPAIVVGVITALLGMPVIFLPLIVYFAYYCYGLWAYEG